MRSGEDRAETCLGARRGRIAGREKNKKPQYFIGAYAPEREIIMQKFKSKKLLAIALAVVLTLSLATTAFAAWPSFQNTNTNNGVIDPVANGIPNTTTYPLNNPSDPTQGTTGPTPITVALENAGGWIGVDAVSVINEGVVYTLHNSGSGANVAATNLVDGTSVWTDEAIVNPNVQSGDAQLSTPYYDVATDTLYVATTASSTIDTASVS